MTLKTNLKKRPTDGTKASFLLIIGLVIGLPSLLILFSCHNKPKQVFTYKLQLNMTEKVLDSTRSLLFNFKSNDFKEKAGFKLNSKVIVDRQNNTIELFLTTKANTPPSSAPLETATELDSLQIGTYQLMIHFKDQNLPGALTLNDHSYMLKLKQNAYVSIKTDTLNKLPRKAIFGTLHYYSPDAEPLIDAFIASLKELGAKDQSYYPGNYHFFVINADGQIKQTRDKGYAYTRHFIFHYDGDKAALKALVKRFAFAHSTQLLITLNTYDGATYNIWSFGD